MHECPGCGMYCDCDGEDHDQPAPSDCICACWDSADCDEDDGFCPECLTSGDCQCGMTPPAEKSNG